MVGCLCGSLVVWRTLNLGSMQNTTPHVSVWDPSGCALNTSTRRELFCGSLKKSQNNVHSNAVLERFPVVPPLQPLFGNENSVVKL